MTKTISSLEVGESFQQEDDLILLLSAVKKANFTKGIYYQLTFQDNTGNVNGVMWEVPTHLEKLPEQCEENEGLFVKFIGSVTEFKGNKQLTAKDLIIVPDSEVDSTNFIPVVSQDRGELWKKVKELISEVEDQDYKRLLVAVFNDSDIRKKFVNGIGGIRHHHNYIGGLLEHTVQVTVLALQAVDGPFCFPDLNRDLIITGGLLHDIGKTNEYLFSKSLKMNPDGIEHRYEGISMIDMIVYKNNLDIDPSKLRPLKNIIMSHHGDYGDSSIKIEYPEGIVIHHADATSAHVNKHFITEGN